MISGKFVNIIIHKDFIPELCSTSTIILQAVLTHTFLLWRNTQFCEFLVPKIQQVMFLTFSSYSIKFYQVI